MKLSSTLLAVGLSATLFLALPDRLAACAFHTALPEATVSEQIAGSLAVIAARPANANPFRFEAVTVLKGDAPYDHPPHLVDSGTRSRLSRNPSDAVLFARNADGSWTRLIMLDAATRPIVDHILDDIDRWASPEGASARRDLFAGLLDHPDDRIRRLALRELDALPYSVLREGHYPIGAENLLNGLTDMQEIPFAPIRILLLGLTQGDAAKAAIDHQVRRMARDFGDMHLGAWITAAIEIGGPDGLAKVEQLFLGKARQSTETQIAAIIQALAVQRAGGDIILGPAIDATLRRLAEANPKAAPQIARTFGATSDYSQASLIRDLVSARAFSSPGDFILAATYVMGADLEASADQATKERPRPAQISTETGSIEDR